MPGGPKPAKNMQQQQRGQKQQQQVDRPRGQDKKQVNKLLENPKQGKPQGDKRQAGPKGDGGKQQAGPKGDGGKKFGDYLKDKDRDRPTAATRRPVTTKRTARIAIVRGSETI